MPWSRQHVEGKRRGVYAPGRAAGNSKLETHSDPRIPGNYRLPQLSPPASCPEFNLLQPPREPTKVAGRPLPSTQALQADFDRLRAEARRIRLRGIAAWTYPQVMAAGAARLAVPIL